MKVTFYGVRGSIPSPGPEYIEYGGNTACVYIELSDGTHLILDAGTGIKPLGKHLFGQPSDIHLLLTHNHWDHIQGFPFFAPLFEQDRVIHITPGQTDYPDEDDAVLQQMKGSTFPVPYQSLKCEIRLQSRFKDLETRQIGNASVTALAMNHPGGGSAYRIEADGYSIAYITDNELYPPYRKQTDFLQWCDFAKGADLIIHDAQYMVTDMPAKSGWGHSIAEEAVKLAMASEAKALALYSHDHERTDADIRDIEQHCRTVLATGGAATQVFAAAEGLTLEYE